MSKKEIGQDPITNQLWQTNKKLERIEKLLSQTLKVDLKATDGLEGVYDSLAYRVHEIEKHLHSSGSWFGAAAVPSGETHVADRIAGGISPFQLDAGDSDWGTWVQILGSEDTPARTNQVYFDPHEAVITSTQKAGTYFIQIARGDSGAAGLAAGTYTEFVFESDAVGQKAAGITKVQTGRASAGSKLWARCLCVGENTATIDFYIGIHEYIG